jgi:hypothetical protein
LKIRKASTAYPENSEKKKPSKHLSKKKRPKHSGKFQRNTSPKYHIIAHNCKKKSFLTNPNHSICFFNKSFQTNPNHSKQIQINPKKDPNHSGKKYKQNHSKKQNIPHSYQN